ncbi:TniQ family protein [Roseivivax lentus]|nr:TniQ family protein [Roseivivax lentus]
MPHETLVSWTARIARYHANMSSHYFLSLIQLSRQDVVDGTEYGVTRLADLTGVPEARIEKCCIRREGDRNLSHRGECFSSLFMCRTQVSYCPQCLLEDRDTEGASLGMRVGRLSWMFRTVRACHRHGCEVLRRPRENFSEQFQDMEIVAPEDWALKQQVPAAGAMMHSELQEYVERRLAGASGPMWLDEQPIDQAAKACEMLGACMEYGAHCDLDRLVPADWHCAGAVGFEATSQGVKGIRAALDQIQRKSAGKYARGGGPQAIFGRLYQWLQFNKGGQDRGPIRHVLREHILDAFPIGPGTRLFGECVTQRRRHSVSSLSRESGLHPKTLSRALVRSGLIQEQEEQDVDPWSTADARQAGILVQKIKHSIPVKQVPKYLNCNRRQAELLVREGILPQLVTSERFHGGVLTNVAIEDIEAFLSKFRRHGREVSAPDQQMIDVITASELVRVPVVDIVRMVLDGQLSNIELLDLENGFRSVLVDPSEVRSAVDRADEQSGLSAREVANELEIFSSGPSQLRKNLDRDGQPFLKAVEIRNSKGKAKHRYAPAEVERFKKRYVKLGDLANERGISAKAMSKRLRENGVSTIVPRNLLNAAFYRRADL